MSYTTVPDKNSGDLFTEAMWDTYVKDNINTAIWHPLADVILAADSATVVLSGIPATMIHLALTMQLRDSDAASAAETRLRFNGDSGANYDSQQLTNTAATTLVGSESFAQTGMLVGAHPAANAPAEASGATMVIIPHYTNTTAQKTAVSYSGYKIQSSANGMNARFCTGHWRNTSAITSVTIFTTSAGQLVTGSRVTVYGIGV